MRSRAVVAALLLSALTACGDTSGSEPTTTASRGPASSAPVAPDGTRLVGVGRVVVGVPQQWGSQATPCGQPTGDTVYFVEAGAQACRVDQKGTASLAIAPASSPIGREIAATTGKRLRVDGLDVRISDTVCTMSDPGVCSVTVVVSRQDAAFLLHVPSQHPRQASVLKNFVNSVQLLPPGYTTVPVTHYGMSVEDAKQVLADAGLAGVSPDVDWPHYATGTKPAAGTVVAVDEVVHLTIGDG